VSLKVISVPFVETMETFSYEGLLYDVASGSVGILRIVCLQSSSDDLIWVSEHESQSL
jgi:hypothetical protein